ncbi:sugar ABC transporter permease [Undibacterium cyanobacteriorum]|uniref:Sugar ABC transporter permease n=1 Tax=Undibacterium cyanobacteriorum TaxID=3073561 RepID=A0ABY9RJ01_9BURK|nr:sugar ABC transporter permease [Undibacterium sp. 20NA77.5]WMW80640.1 sugar ABC transporter permease [Undibacterium sp. 20NA77.5]
MRLKTIARKLIPYGAITPLALIVLVAYVGTVLWSIKISLTSSRSLPTDTFVGMTQYAKLFENERWLLSIENLAIYSVLFIVASMVIGFLLAAFIDQKVKAEGVLRTVFLYPYAMSFVATGLVWQWMLTPGIGIENAVRQWGFPNFEFDWIIDQDKVIYTIVIATVWQTSGLVMAMMLAGLRGIDQEIWKATRLDGIPAWRVYLSIILPMMAPTLATVFLLLSTAAIKLFDSVVAMTQGGPGTASEVPAKFIMDHLFGRANIALASAGAVMLLVPVVALLAPYMYARMHARSNARSHATSAVNKKEVPLNKVSRGAT